MRRLFVTAAAAAALGTGSAAHASEIFGGVLAHDVDTPITKSGIEEGVEIQLGWRGERIEALRFIGRPSPYALLSAHSEGETHYAAVGLSWRIGDPLYLRPGLGLAVHTGPGRVVPGDDRIDFGSRILFAPEVAVGYRINPQWSVEGAWVHLSHAQIFGGQNPGMDSIGVRLNYRFR